MVPHKPFSLSVKAIVRDADGRCLLLKRSPASKGNPCKWDLPGGKLDPCETFDAGLLREIAEETGLTVSLERIAGTAESETAEKRVVYLIMEALAESAEVTLSEEHTEHAWVPIAELPQMDLVPHFRALAEQYAALRHAV